MSPFDRFRQHVQQQPDAVAVITPYRTATYRKMWSRIERSTARLQGEWHIARGDTIAYLGCGHLDALVMYFAAARCGARVLPLEHADLQAEAPALAAAAGVALLLHDDALAIDAGRFGMPCRILSSLIATPCKYRENVSEDSNAISLLQWPAQARERDEAPDVGMLQARSLDALAAGLEAMPATSAVPATHGGPGLAPAAPTVRAALFDAAVFGPIVLQALLAGQVLRFDPTAA